MRDSIATTSTTATTTTATASSKARETLLERFARTRATTESLAAPLSPEDQQLQSMASCSPTKWHRAHTTWFFEKFLLEPAGQAPYDAAFDRIFNSYYETIGGRDFRIARDRRGMLSRPSTAEIAAYRRNVDERVAAFIGAVDAGDHEAFARAASVVEIGLAHEEQHQELVLTDILNAFAANPLASTYRKLMDDENSGARANVADDAGFIKVDGGLVYAGAGDEGFAFDNERPRHRVFVEPFSIAARPITVRELRAFIDADGYTTPTLWLSDGFDVVHAEGWRAPLYTRYDGVSGGGGLYVFTLRGWRRANDDEPASHLSFWEADAIARFLRARLPTEAEWELAAIAVGASSDDGNFADGPLFPIARPRRSFYGDVWQWTRSSYEPYPGFATSSGALGEYNGKFMAQQFVLRGGSCLTPRGHVRATYRNFWHPSTRFQMTGARLARNA